MNKKNTRGTQRLTLELLEKMRREQDKGTKRQGGARAWKTKNRK